MAQQQISGLKQTDFQDTVNGKPVHLFLLRNQQGMHVSITNWGGRVVELIVPNAKGKKTDVVTGFRSLKDYFNSTEPYYGCIIGRYGNRIANGEFALEGKQYILATNNGPNTLHGGKMGFQSVVWDALQPNDSTLELQYLSPDGEENFPGNLKVKVIYQVTSKNEFKISYEAETDKTTVINLTNHAFFNLNGEGEGTINNHLLMINADEFTPINVTSIPLGSQKPVSETPFDFRKLTVIGKRLNAFDEQLNNGNGYDHNFVLKGEGMRHAATVVGDKSKIMMEVYTDEPGLQFYGGNFMQGKNIFKNGTRDLHRTAFCLETQHFPDSPNQPSFPSTILTPGVVYSSNTVYRFSIKR